MSKSEQNEMRIETEIASNLAKYWYEKLEAKAVEVICATGLRENRAVRLHDIASILDQLPEPERQEYKSDNALRADGAGQLGELEKPLPVSRIVSEPEKQLEVKEEMTQDKTEIEIKEKLLKACNGHPHAKIAWPHRLLHEAHDYIKKLETDKQVLKELGYKDNKLLVDNAARVIEQKKEISKLQAKVQELEKEVSHLIQMRAFCHWA